MNRADFENWHVVPVGANAFITMYYENETDFDEAAWSARLDLARTNDDFVTLLKELPTEKPMTDDEAIESFKAESTWESIDSADTMLGWCRFWFVAEWCLPAAQQARCTDRLMRGAGYSLETVPPDDKHSVARESWQRSMIKMIQNQSDLKSSCPP